MKREPKVRATPVPTGPARVRPALGALLITLGTVGCAHKNPPMPPMPPPMPEPPMAPPPMPNPGDGDPAIEEPPMDPPSEPPLAAEE